MSEPFNVSRLLTIIEAAAHFTGLKIRHIRMHTRRQYPVLVRHIVWYHCIRDLDWSASAVGRCTGTEPFDHATVLHGVKVIEHALAENVAIAEFIRPVLKRLRTDVPAMWLVESDD